MSGKSAIKNVVFSLLQQLIAIICGFIVPKLIIKAYGSNVNGLITSITQFLAYITLLEAGVGPVIKSQLYNPIVKKNTVEIENILYSSERYFRKISKIFVIYIIVLLVIYPILVNSEFSRVFSMTLIAIISLSSIAEYYFGMTYRLFLQADKKSYIISIIQTATTILNAIVIVLLVLLEVNILLVKLFSSFIFILRPVLQYLYVKKRYTFKLINVNRNYKLKNKWDGLAQHIAAIIYSNTDVAVLTIFQSVMQVSIYSVYNLVISSLQKILQSISTGIDASFGELIAKAEIEKLREAFNKYEIIYYSMITVIYICTFVLIIPFVEIYTHGIEDVNYIVPVFGFIMVLSSFIYSIKIPYHSLIKTAGHFKETQIGAWIEAVINLILSIVLVSYFGLVGVAIGTLMATLFRTIELVIYTTKNILKNNTLITLKKILIALLEILIFSIYFYKKIKVFKISSFIGFVILAIKLFIVIVVVVVVINGLIYRKTLIPIIKNLIGKKVNI